MGLNLKYLIFNPNHCRKITKTGLFKLHYSCVRCTPLQPPFSHFSTKNSREHKNPISIYKPQLYTHCARRKFCFLSFTHQTDYCNTSSTNFFFNSSIYFDIFHYPTFVSFKKFIKYVIFMKSCQNGLCLHESISWIAWTDDLMLFYYMLVSYIESCSSFWFDQFLNT